VSLSVSLAQEQRGGKIQAMQAMASASFLSCMKQGGGVDIITALKYFDALDDISSMVPQPVRRSRSASLLDSLPGHPAS
jgi:hypothetical protein